MTFGWGKVERILQLYVREFSEETPDEEDREGDKNTPHSLILQGKTTSAYMSIVRSILNRVQGASNGRSRMGMDTICDRMFIAALEGNLELVKSLPSTAREREKAFAIAACKGYVKVMMYLFRQGVNIHADGNSALHLAALSERMDIVDLLLDMAGVSYTSYPLLILPLKARARVKRHMDMCAKLSSSVPDGVLYKMILRYY